MPGAFKAHEGWVSWLMRRFHQKAAVACVEVRGMSLKFRCVLFLDFNCYDMINTMALYEERNGDRIGISQVVELQVKLSSGYDTDSES